MSLRGFSSAMRTRSTPYSRRGALIRDESMAQQQARHRRELKESEKYNRALTVALTKGSGA